MTTKKWEVTGFVGGAVLFGIFVYFSALFLSAWLLMLIIGALHSYFPSIPAVGFWPMFFITWLLFLVAGIFKSSGSG